MRRQDKRPAGNCPTEPPPSSIRWWLLAAAAGLAIAALAAILALGSPRQDPDRLVGRWVRPDGGYVIEIRDVDEAGRVDAAYFNPNSIHIAEARITRDGTVINLFIELRDVNYPGSTYLLTYDPAEDQLKGSYYQAVARETYEIFFERMN